MEFNWWNKQIVIFRLNNNYSEKVIIFKKTEDYYFYKVVSENYWEKESFESAGRLRMCSNKLEYEENKE